MSLIFLLSIGNRKCHNTGAIEIRGSFDGSLHDYEDEDGLRPQLKVFEESNHDLKAVVNYKAKETAEDL